MPKTTMTLDIENAMRKEFSKQGVFCCFEVTIGWYGKERVDFMSYDTKNTFRCYEIKVSQKDFNSNAAITFCGHYNYYVMPKELYNIISTQIPDYVGVYIFENNFIYIKKRAKRRDLLVDEKILKDSLIRSLSRDAAKYYKNKDSLLYSSLQQEYNSLKKEKEKIKTSYNRLLLFLIKKLKSPFWKEFTNFLPRKEDVEKSVRNTQIEKLHKHRELRALLRNGNITEEEFEQKIIETEVEFL